MSISPQFAPSADHAGAVKSVSGRPWPNSTQTPKPRSLSPRASSALHGSRSASPAKNRPHPYRPARAGSSAAISLAPSYMKPDVRARTGSTRNVSRRREHQGAVARHMAGQRCVPLVGWAAFARQHRLFGALRLKSGREHAAGLPAHAPASARQCLRRE